MKPRGSSCSACSRLHAAIAALPPLPAFGLATAAFALVGVSTLPAADLTWDADTGTTAAQAGSGTWLTTGSNWWNGTANTAWVNTTAANANTGFTATLGGSDGAYTLTTGAPIIASNLNVTASGYTLVNSGSNFLTLTFTTTTGSGTFTSAASQIFVAAGKTFNIGAGTDSTIVKANGGGALSTSSQIHVETGSILNINAGASLLRDNNSGANNGGIRFTGGGTVNVFGTVSNTANNDGIRIGEYDANSTTFNVKSGGLLTTASSGSNVSGGALTVAGGSGTATAGTVTLNIESGGTVSVTNTASTQGFSLARQAGSVGIANVSGTLITPKIVAGNGAAGAIGTLNIDGGTIRATRNEAAFIERLNSATLSVNIKAGGATIDSNGFNIGTSQALLDGTGGGGLTKNGTGNLTLSGANTYTGTTTVNGGGLLLNSTNTSNLVVNSGGTIGGVGGSTSGSLVTNTGANILANVTGAALAVNGGVNFAGMTTATFNGTPLSGSTYDILSYTGGLSNLSNLVPTNRATIADTGTKITATIGAIGTRTWNTTSGTWDIGQSNNWSEGDAKFFNADSVVFNDPASASVVTLSNNLGALLPAAVTVDNTNGYTFSGTGSIAGVGTLTKNGTGTLTINTANTYSGGSTITNGSVVLGHAAALGTGSVALNGGALNLNNQTLANAVVAGGGQITGTGTVSGVLSGASLTHADPGKLTLTNTANTLTALTISGGTVSIANNGSLAAGTTLDGGALETTNTAALTISRPITVGAGGGSLNIVGAATAGQGSRVVMSAANVLLGSGSLTVSGTGNLESAGGQGAFVISGANTFNGNITLQNGGMLEVDNAAAVAPGATFTLGNKGEVTLANGKTSATAIAVNGTNGFISFNNSSTGIYSGAITLNADVNIGLRDWYNYATARGGSLNGVISGAGGLATNRGTSTGAATLTLNGVNTYTGNTTVAAGTTVKVGSAGQLGGGAYAGAIANEGTVEFNTSANQTLSGVISGAGLFTQSGAGTTTLTGANTYTGATSVTAGKLIVNGSLANTVVTVGASASLGGSGVIGGATTINGTLAPGNSPGLLTFSGDLTLGSGSTAVFEINGAGRGTGFDAVNVGGALTYGGTLNLVFDAPLSAGVYDLLGGGFLSQTGDFSTVLFGGSETIAGLGSVVFTGGSGWTATSDDWNFSFNNASGDLTILSTAIPEPASFAALAGVAGLGLAALRRRRRS